MPLNLNYEKYRQQMVMREQLRNIGWLLGSILCALGAAGATYVAINARAASGVVLLCGGLTVVFIIALVMTCCDYLANKAERPASLLSVQTLISQVDRLENRQIFVDEIATLLQQQGELYQYQVHALLLATQQQRSAPVTRRSLGRG